MAPHDGTPIESAQSVRELLDVQSELRRGAAELLGEMHLSHVEQVMSTHALMPPPPACVSCASSYASSYAPAPGWGHPELQ